jgi:ribosomal protein S18 acetylase RimI-like enzyme
MTEPLDIHVRPGDRGDEPLVRRLSARLFSRFGEYERTLPALIGLPGMHLLVACSGEDPVGFALYSADEPQPGTVDLTAIAVDRPWQSRGVGRRLLERVEEEARRLAAAQRLPARMHLTVAESNAAGRALFERAGYTEVPGERGHYSGGQRSIGMARILDP